MSNFITIAIDGPSASGKGTLARRLADQFHLFYLDSGAVYRTVGKHILDKGQNPDSPEDATAAAKYIQDNLTWDMISDTALRNDTVADATSRASRFPTVRTIITDTLRTYANHPLISAKQKPYQGSIVDGRDIGTVVLPDANIKLYVTAETEARAKRRFLELTERKIDTSYDTVLADMMDRDARDSGRTASPLRPADDAILFDTTHMEIDEAFDKAVQIIRDKLA